jgi:hypothetical protein
MEIVQSKVATIPRHTVTSAGRNRQGKESAGLEHNKLMF